MTKNFRIILAVLVLLVGFCFVYGFMSQTNKQTTLEKQNANVAGYADSIIPSVDSAVVTLPNGNVIVGLAGGNAQYTSSSTKTNGNVSLDTSLLQTEFIPGIVGGPKPRLDAVVPMYVTGDAQGGSMYIVLFWDRGDVSIEESYMRLGGPEVIIQKINILPGTGDQEYQVDVAYKQEGVSQQTNQIVSISKELTVPVIGGHFYPNGLVTK